MARALNSINTRRKQRPGNDLIYGPGGDGDVTITGTTILTEDKYYNNLTVNSGTNLVTNGFRVFVKETLTNNGTIGLPAAFAGETGIGTLVGRVKDGTSGVPKSYVLGESASGTQVSAARLRNLDLVMRGGANYYKHGPQAVLGYQITAGQTTPLFLNGGSGGTSGDGVGGGVVIIAARYVSIEPGGGAVISATGGTNAGGGVIILISSALTLNPALTLNVSGAGTGADGTANYIEVT